MAADSVDGGKDDVFGDDMKWSEKENVTNSSFESASVGRLFFLKIRCKETSIQELIQISEIDEGLANHG